MLTGCSNSIEKQLASDATIAAIFNKSEIKDLAMVVDFFNSHICSTQKNDVAKCYLEFFKMMEEHEIAGVYDIKIPAQERQKLYCQITENTFNQIWRIDHRWYRSYRDESDTIQSTENQFTGKYLKFLEAFGKDDKVAELYFDGMKKVGDFGAYIFSGLIRSRYEELNFKDIRTQLFVALHFLTSQDNVDEGQKFKRVPFTTFNGYAYKTLTRDEKYKKTD